MKLLLSPHSDDETLFAAYVQQQHRPLVIVCFQGRRARHLPRNSVRELESTRACAILGTTVRFLPIACDPPDWPDLETTLRLLDPDQVWAPLPEPYGHPQHNGLGHLANALWPDRTTWYSTYRVRAGKVERSTVGTKIAATKNELALKLAALHEYKTQWAKSDTAMHFNGHHDEYVTQPYAADWVGVRDGLHPELKLNLGAGHNRIPGFANLDPTYTDNYAWRFQDGLGPHETGSIDAITISHALMYVPLTDWPYAYSEFSRVLRPGGTIRITEDAIAEPDSTRQDIRPGAAVATNPQLILDHLEHAGLLAQLVTPNVTTWHDTSLVQQNYGEPPDVFHAEATKP